MSDVSIDEGVVVLEGLDFEPDCKKGDKPAEVSVECRACGGGALFCREHIELEGRMIDRAISHGYRLTCASCDVDIRSFDEAYRVVSL